jgi:hypothetical protein
MILLSYVLNSPISTTVVLHAVKLMVALGVVDAIPEELKPGLIVVVSSKLVYEETVLLPLTRNGP